MDVFSFTAYEAANAACDSTTKKFMGTVGDDFFSSTLLKTGSTKHSPPMQLVQKCFNV